MCILSWLKCPFSWCFIKPYCHSYNVLREAWGANRILHYLLAFYNFGLAGYAAYIVKCVLDYYYRSEGADRKSNKKNKSIVMLRMMMLVPQILGKIAGGLASIDPIGIFHIFDFIMARSLVNLAATLGTFADIAMLFFCFDLFNTFKSAASMKKNKSVLSLCQAMELIVFVVAFAMIIVDQIISYLGLTGVIGSDSSLISALYQLFTHFVFTIALLVVRTPA